MHGLGWLEAPFQEQFKMRISPSSQSEQ